MCRKRSLTNEQALLQALRGALPAPLEVRRYVGSDRLTLAATAQLFSRAALLTGPHGGAFLNMIYCSAGTPVVEIGYARARSPSRREALATGVHKRVHTCPLPSRGPTADVHIWQAARRTDRYRLLLLLPHDGAAARAAFLGRARARKLHLPHHRPRL